MTQHLYRPVAIVAVGLALALATSGAAIPPAAAASKGKDVRLDGYLEYRKAGGLIVEAQLIQTDAKTRFKGAGKVKKLADVPLGYEMQVKGTRQADGIILAREIVAKPNGKAFMEDDVLQGTNQAEQAYVKAKKVSDTGADGKEKSLGELLTTGPQVDRARRIVDRLLPAYVDPKSVRVYVVENKEWNAMAMANYSIYVFSGLMADTDDDELAIVLGHEIAHATHEHSRRQAKKGMITGITGQVANIGAGMIGNDMARSAAQGATALGVTTVGNVYSREDEDQADRVGLRYVYEAGYDVTKAPALWKRFAAKYGDSSKVENFFFGSHSLSKERAAELEREIRSNYSDPAKDPPSHTGRAAGTGGR
jgi:Zn-dependent protease with chaperone function